MVISFVIRGFLYLENGRKEANYEFNRPSDGTPLYGKTYF